MPAVDNCCAALTALLRPCFPPILFELSRVGRDRHKVPAPKEQPPRKLSGKRTARLVNIWKETPPGIGGVRRRDNTLRHSDRWGFDRFSGMVPGNPARAHDACARRQFIAETHAPARAPPRTRG